MKIMIMSDMEGVAGMLDHDNWVTPTGCNYAQGKRLLTLEINAAVEGFFEAGADEVQVADAHGFGGIDVELLDRRATLQRGFIGPHPFGLDESFDAVAWVGQHPKAGTVYGHICHTGWFNVIDYRINDISVGEFGQLVFAAGELGAVPIFASGDLAFTKEAQALVPGIETAAVKRGLTPGDGRECNCDRYRAHNLAAIHLSPSAARERICVQAKAALTRFLHVPDSFQPVRISAPYTKRVIMRDMGDVPAHVEYAEHPTSVIGLLNI